MGFWTREMITLFFFGFFFLFYVFFGVGWAVYVG